MASFLHKPYLCSVLYDLQHLLNLYTESCEAVKVLEASNKKLEIIVADQGKIAEAKTQHYEDKLKKDTQDVEVKLATAQVDHEQAMISFRVGIKKSTAISLMQARIEMAYEVRETGLECPAWPVDSWVAMLKDLGGNHVSYPAKSGVGEPLKAAEVAVEAGEKTEAGADAGQDDAQDAVVRT
ncbi:hypothetical protein Hanom_Chr14g01277111 [Helianthus anomalus]